MYKKILLKLFFLLMNAIPHQICNNNCFGTRHFINNRNNKSLQFKQEREYMGNIIMVEKGFGAFKIIILICYCFSYYC